MRCWSAPSIPLLSSFPWEGEDAEGGTLSHAVRPLDYACRIHAKEGIAECDREIAERGKRPSEVGTGVSPPIDMVARNQVGAVANA